MGPIVEITVKIMLHDLTEHKYDHVRDLDIGPTFVSVTTQGKKIWFATSIVKGISEERKLV